MSIKTKTKTITEPIGSAAPKFSQETKSLSFVKPVDITLSLLCAAQGAPLPSYRLAKNKCKGLSWYIKELMIWTTEQELKLVKHTNTENSYKKV